MGPDSPKASVPLGHQEIKERKRPEIKEVYTRKKIKTAQAPPRVPRATPATLLARVLPSVVSVAYVPKGRHHGETIYMSGFVVMSYDNHAFIFTKDLEDTTHYRLGTTTDMFVHFHGRNLQKEPAIRICSDKEYMVIAALEERNNNAPASQSIDIPPPQNRASYEMCCTIGTMGGTKVHANSNQDLKHFRGRLGTFFGKVLTPDCTALTHSDSRSRVNGGGKYFTVSCPFKDELVNPDNIDVPSEDHTSTGILAAPFFRMGGEMLGVIDSDSSYFDVKYSFHIHEMMVRLEKTMCNEVKNKIKMDWKEKLKILYHEELPEPAQVPGAQPAAEAQLGGGGDEGAEELGGGHEGAQEPADRAAHPPTSGGGSGDDHHYAMPPHGSS